MQPRHPSKLIQAIMAEARCDEQAARAALDAARAKYRVKFPLSGNAVRRRIIRDAISYCRTW